MSGRVVVVGSVNVDLVIRADRLPAPGETVTGGVFERHHGGKGGNQAVAAARLGRTTLFVGAVGEDDFGEDARAALAAERIEVSRLFAVPGAATGVALIMVDARGENLIAVASGANAALEPAMVTEALGRLGPLADDVVLVCHEIPTETVRAALQYGRTAGATTVFNPAPAAGLDRATLGLADIVTPNRRELAMLLASVGDEGVGPSGGTSEGPASDGVDEADTDAHIEAGARRLLAAGPDGPGVRRAVVVTLGAEGALLVARDPGGGITTRRFPAHRVRSVDSTGAGDAFNGAIAAALAEGRSLEEACRRAIVAGALATTRPGAREGMPTRAELEAALGAAEDGPPAGPSAPSAASSAPEG
ncbi:MAG TPA: ribokinase [Candidatus Binatia bacterium]|nr:ribokinase [Candidatus Binatia bacterium]